MNGAIGGEPPNVVFKPYNNDYERRIPGRLILDWMAWTQESYDQYTDYSYLKLQHELDEYKDQSTDLIGDLKVFGIRGLMKYFLGAEDAERDTKELAPLINYVNYPALYDGPKPEMDNIEMGYGKMTSGLLTVAGGGRSFGVLGEGNAHKKGKKNIDVDEMGVRLREETKGRHGCDNSYVMLTIVPKVDSTA